MAKRFTCTEIWKEDWYIAMPVKYQYFFIYVKDNCDHAGVFKINKVYFEAITKFDIDVETAFELYNTDKERFIKINGTKWLYVDFFVFQYGHKMNLNNRVHKSIYDIYLKLGVKLTSIRGLVEDTEGVKDKDIYNITSKDIKRRRIEGY